MKAPVKVASGIDSVSLGSDSTWLLRKDGSVLALGLVHFRAPGARDIAAARGVVGRECLAGCIASTPVRAPFPGLVAKIYDGACAALRSGKTGCLDHGARQAAPSGAGMCDTAWCGEATDPECRIAGHVAICGGTEVEIE